MYWRVTDVAVTVSNQLQNDVMHHAAGATNSFVVFAVLFILENCLYG